MSNNNHRADKKSAPEAPREVDIAIHESLSRMKKRWILISRRKIATWQGLLIILFLSGFVSALLWAGYRNLYTGIFGEPGEEYIVNQAQVTYEDAARVNYGPVTAIVSVTKLSDLQQVTQVTVRFPKNFLAEKVKIQIQDVSGSALKESSAVLDVNDELVIPIDIALLTGDYKLMLVPPRHLSKQLNVVFDQTAMLFTVSEPDLKPGNLVDTDDIINAADWDIMRGKWGSAIDPEADLNQDGLVNTLDWSIMKKNWGVKGDCPDISTTECRNRG